MIWKTLIKDFHMRYYTMYNQYDTNFDAPDAHFAHSSLFKGTQAEKVGYPQKM
jgi:hypothetical protein